MTQARDRGISRQSREWFRPLAEMFGRFLLREPAAIIPKRSAERLRQLERREQLRMAEREGNDEFLDAELARVQLTPEQLKAASRGTTPISEWPDEDFSGHLGDSESRE